MQTHPLIDRDDVADAGHPQRNEHLGLRQNVLVQHGRPLRYRCATQTAGTAAAHQVLIRTKQPGALRAGALRGEEVRVLDHEVQRVPVTPVDALKEVRGAAALAALGALREVEHHGVALVDDEIGHRRLRIDRQRQVGVLVAEDHHRQPEALAVGGSATAPDDADRVDHAYLEARGDELPHHRGGGMSDSTSLGQDREGLGERQLQVLCQL
ncbi:MAG: hypothetical protein M3R63_23115 [Actinomycetota bacterium]|nr:hypothetical protein [Actinomycetota bacterium]